MRSTSVRSGLLRAVATVLLAAGDAAAGDAFVNFESGHTRPLALSPDGSLLFAVNTPGDSLSIFEVDGAGLHLAAQVPVGLEPVAVASRTNTSTGKVEAWVVNFLSDSVSVVEVNTANPAISHVTHTLLVGDEPRDIVFGGSPIVKAFVTTARRGQNLPATVDSKLLEEGVPRALVFAYDAQDVGDGIGGTPLTVLELFGDSPRALAVSPDGSTVYAAIFHSGNGTAILRDRIVEANGGSPPLPADSPFFNDPDVIVKSLIVKHDPDTDEWNDEIGRDWKPYMKFSLPDRDVFAIDADANPPVLAAGISSYSGVGTTLFNMAVRPGTGSVYVTGSEARNEVRFTPIQAGGIQGHAADERITVLSGMSVMPVYLNPHIDYGVASGPAGEEDDSLALLGDLVFSSDGAKLYAAAMGSDQVAAFDADDLEVGTVTRDLVDVGRGPSGVALDEANDRLYVMNRLDHTISIVGDASNESLRAETAVVSVGEDPTPDFIREGRPFLYRARGMSGHGDLACATCHTFGDNDSLAWELGDPYGTEELDPNPFVDIAFPFGTMPYAPFTPLKGPMVTQSLRGLADAGPMHWRGDRSAAYDPGGSAFDEDGAFKKFNAAFVDLLGRPEPLTNEEMQAFTDFVLSIRYPPNPIRSLDNELTKDQARGLEIFQTNPDLGFDATCADCHSLPLGTGGLSVNEDFDSFKVPHLRAVYQKVGMFGEERFGKDPDNSFKGDQVRGFGLLNDGAITTPVQFASGFQLDGLEDVNFGLLIGQFLLAFDPGLAPIVGQQLTIGASPTGAQEDRLELLRERQKVNECDLTVSALIAGEPLAGLVLPNGNVLTDDSTAPPIDADTLPVLAALAGGQQTYTCRPPGTGRAATVDRDGDGVMNSDELREGTDPLDADSAPYDCIGGGQISSSKLTITKILPPAGDERLSLKASWPAISPPIDPVQDGITFLLRDAAGEIAWYQTLPAAGWSGDGTKWSYEGSEGSIVAKAKLAAKDGVFSLTLKGRDGDFLVDTPNPQLEVVFGGEAAAAAGRCATRSFGSADVPACELDKKLRCS